MAKKPHITQKTESFVIHYEQAEKITKEQLKILWFGDEIKLEKDEQDLRVNLTESEKHATTTGLRLFTLYERKAGTDYWAGRFMKTFPRPELEAMAATFACFELAIHKVFYNKINELLHLNTDEFYLSYVNDPVLKSRMEFIDKIVSHKNNLISLAGFSMVEGVVLYANFSFFKHFQVKGKNKLLNLCRGIDMSLRDENIHSLAGAWAFRELLAQMELSDEELAELEKIIREVANALAEHEFRIIDMMFEKGPIDGITPNQMKIFVKSRVNECLHNLGFTKEFDIGSYNPIAEWFYDSINKFTYNDFFSGQGKEYTRNWDAESFTW